MTISHDGLFSVGRDLDGSLTVNGNLVLEIGRPAHGRPQPREPDCQRQRDRQSQRKRHRRERSSGRLCRSNGLFQGQGGTAAPTFFDLGVGLSLDGLSILGGNTAQNSLINANIRAGGSISGVDIAYGTVNSTIQPNTPPPE